MNMRKREHNVGVNISMPKSYARLLRHLSLQSGLSVSEIARRALDLYFEKVGVSPIDYNEVEDEQN